MKKILSILLVILAMVMLMPGSSVMAGAGDEYVIVIDAEDSGTAYSHPTVTYSWEQIRADTSYLFEHQYMQLKYSEHVLDNNYDDLSRVWIKFDFPDGLAYPDHEADVDSISLRLYASVFDFHYQTPIDIAVIGASKQASQSDGFTYARWYWTETLATNQSVTQAGSPILSWYNDGTYIITLNIDNCFDSLHEFSDEYDLYIGIVWDEDLDNSQVYTDVDDTGSQYISFVNHEGKLPDGSDGGDCNPQLIIAYTDDGTIGQLEGATGGGMDEVIDEELIEIMVGWSSDLDSTWKYAIWAFCCIGAVLGGSRLANGNNKQGLTIGMGGALVATAIFMAMGWIDTWIMLIFGGVLLLFVYRKVTA